MLHMSLHLHTLVEDVQLEEKNGMEELSCIYVYA